MQNASSLHAKLAVLKAKALLFKIANRWPAGTPQGKGGQFAPKQGGGGGGGATPAKWSFGGHSGAAFGQYGANPAVPPTPPKGAKPHKQMGEDGRPVLVHYPTRPSAPDTWTDKAKVATFTPGGKTPGSLNGVAFKSWAAPKDKAGWAKVGGTNPALDDVPFQSHPTKKTGAGVLVVEPDGRVWLTRPTNSFGGYIHTYPKGTAEDGLTLQQNAIKEAYEETGLKVRITGLLGDFERDTSKARIFIARRVGGTPADMGWESQAMRLAPMKEAMTLLNKSHDKDILDTYQHEIGLVAKAAGAWTKQDRWPAGTPVGGQWKAMGVDGITLPPKLGSASNPSYDKKAAALHQAAQAGDLTTVYAYVTSNADKLKKFEDAKTQKIAPNSQTKWAAGSVQYAQQLLVDMNAKPKAVASVDAITGPEKLSSLKLVGAKPGGSNPGGVYEDANGTKWLVKGSNGGIATPRSQNEVLASKLLAAAGVGVPDMKLVDLGDQYGGGIGVASKMISSFQSLDAAGKAGIAAAQADFAVHAWLANYDAIGLSKDNTVIQNGKAINIDPGGALLYRAQGKLKSDFGNTVGELTSLRDSKINAAAASVYASMTASQIAESAKKVAAVDDATIKKLCETYGPGKDADRAALASKLIARKADLLAQVAAMNTPASPPQPKPAPVAAPPAPAAPAAPTKVNERVFVSTVDGANKFYAVSVHGNRVMTRWGKNGTEGVFAINTYADSAAANAEASKIINAKMKKGYTFEQETQLAAKHAEKLVGVSQNAASVSQTPPPVTPKPTPVAATASVPVKPKFDGLNSKTFDKHAQVIAGMSPSELARAEVKGNGQIQITTSIGTINLKDPPKSADGKKFYAYFNELKGQPATPAATQALPKTGLYVMPQYVAASPGVKGKYEQETLKAQKAHAAGNIDALKTIFNDKAQFQSTNSQMMAAHVKNLILDLESKQQAATQETLNVAVPAQPEKPVGNLPAMPAPSVAKFSTDGITSKATLKDKQTHNAKIDAIAALGSKGDAKAILAMGFGVNTYGKKQAAYANDVLAATGVPYKVFAGQKAGTHQALNAAGVMTAQAATQAATAAVNAQPKATPAAKASAPVYRIPSAPDFANWNGPGQGLSSKAAFNKQNTEIANKIFSAAKSGDLAALKNLKFQPINADGTPTGSQVLVSSHPSKNITAYLKDAIDAATNPYEPLTAVSAASFARVSDKFTALTKSFNDVAKLTEAKHKMGRYAVLGKVAGNPLANWSPKELSKKNGGLSTSDLYKQSIARFNALSATEKQAIKDYTGSGYSSMNNAATGEGTHSKTGYAIKGFDKASVPLKAGTVLSRKFSFGSGGDTAMKQLLEAEGKVLKDFGVISTSVSPSVWSGDIHLRMVAGEGVKGLYVANNPNGGGGAISKHPGEDEIVLPYGTKFFVRKVYPKGKEIKDAHGTWGGSGKTVVEVVILPNI